MSYIFNNCSSLISLPDISKWKVDNINNMNNMFDNCFSLLFKISNFNNINAIDKSFIIVDNYYLSSKIKNYNFDEYNGKYSNNIIDKDNSTRPSTKIYENIEDELLNENYELNNEKYDDDDDEDFNQLLGN